MQAKHLIVKSYQILIILLVFSPLAAWAEFYTTIMIYNQSSHYDLFCKPKDTPAPAYCASNGKILPGQSNYCNTHGSKDCNNPLRVECTVKNHQDNTVVLGELQFYGSYSYNGATWTKAAHGWTTTSWPADQTTVPHVKMDDSGKNLKVYVNIGSYFNNQKVTGDYGGKYGDVKYSNVKISQIVPYGAEVVLPLPSGRGWLYKPDPTDSSKGITNGIYRVTYSYDISSDRLAYQPPVVTFQILAPDPDENDKLSQIGDIDRGYAFYYRNSPTSVSLKNEFLFVVPYDPNNPPVQTIYLQAGYYDNDDDHNVFHPQGEPYPLNLKLDNIIIDVNDPPMIEYAYEGDPNQSSVSNLMSPIQAWLFNNNRHQAMLEPILCKGNAESCVANKTSTSGYITPGDTTTDKTSSIYNNILLVEKANTKYARLVSNYQPKTDDGIISRNFGDAYLKSPNFCELQKDPTKSEFVVDDSVNTSYCAGLNGGITDEKMSTYPPPFGDPGSSDIETGMPYSTPSPMYFSLRPEAEIDSPISLALCYVYQNSGGDFIVSCTNDEGNDTVSICVNKLDATKSDTDTRLNTLGLQFAYDKSTGDINVYDAAYPAQESAGVKNDWLPSQLFLGNVGWASTKDGSSTQNLFSDDPGMRYYFHEDTKSGSDMVGCYYSLKAEIEPSGYTLTSTGLFQNKTVLTEPYVSYATQITNIKNPPMRYGIVDNAGRYIMTYRYCLYGATPNCHTTNQVTHYKDNIYVYAGFPGWVNWLNNDYAHNHTDNAIYGTQPFMVVANQHDGANQPSNYHQYLSSYYQLGYDQFGKDNLVVPFPVNFSQNGLAVRNLSPHKDINNDNYGTDLYRSCSYVLKEDTDSKSFFTNSFCVYAGSPGDKVGHIKVPSTNQKYLASDFAITGVRDIFGNAYPIIMCQQSTCGTNPYTNDLECECTYISNGMKKW